MSATGEPEIPDYAEVIGDLAGDQHALALGAGYTVLTGYDTVTVTGPDRLTWLTTLSSQVVTDIGADSREFFLLDAQGHIAHGAGVLDDGETTWLLTDRGRGEELREFLDRMRFLLRVEVVSRSGEVTQIGLSATGPVADAAATLVEAGDAVALWRDPWPGVTPGGTTYSTSDPHPGGEWQAARLVVPTARLDDVLAELRARASKCASFPLHTDDGYRVDAPIPVGQGAWEAQRVATWRPRLAREVDERALPHEYDWLRTAVHLHKGCYCGQETVARIVNLGRPPRRLVACTFDGSRSELPVPGAVIAVENRTIGRVTSVARDAWEGPVGLGLVKRANRALDAQVTWDDAEGTHAVAVRLTPIVDPEGRAAASPATRPGAGIGRLPGAAAGMRIGGN